MRTTGVFSAICVAGLTVLIGCETPPPDGSTEEFNKSIWSRGPSPHRIAMARSLVQRRTLIGQPRLEVEALLGRAEAPPSRFACVGWYLGVPVGSPPMYPNDKWLCAEFGKFEKIVGAEVKDDE